MHRPIEKHDGRSTDCRSCNPQLARQAQAAYVAQWRAEHPTQVYTAPDPCPLCGLDQQTSVRLESMRDEMVRRHQEAHGDDWVRYLQAGGAMLAAGADRATAGEGQEG